MSVHGRVVFLNGTSSSGKSSLLRAIQAQSARPFLELGLDRFIWSLPKAYLDAPLWHDVFRYHRRGGELRITPGPLGDRLVSGMHAAIAAVARAGLDVLADHVLLSPHWVRHCAVALDGLPAYLVGIRCPLEVLEARERERGDRTLGQARAQYDLVHAHAHYDLEVDTSVDTAESGARAVLARLESGALPTALTNLRDQRRP